MSLAGEIGEAFLWPLLARAVSIGGGRFDVGFSDLLLSLSCSVDTARI